MRILTLNKPGLVHHVSAMLILALSLATPAIQAAGGGSGPAIVDGQANYFTLEPTFVVNIIDGGKLRYMQLELDLMSMDSEAIHAVQEHHAPIRHELLMLFAHRDISEVLGLKQRELLRKEALTRIQNTLFKYAHINSKAKHETEDGKNYFAGIQEVLFTSFVIQ